MVAIGICWACHMLHISIQKDDDANKTIIWIAVYGLKGVIWCARI